jgi:hypothetical protein
MSGTGSGTGMYVDNASTTTFPRIFYGFSKNGVEQGRIMYQQGSMFLVYKDYNSATERTVEFKSGGIEIEGSVARKAGGGPWADNSDSRLKKNISSLDSEAMLSKVLEMRGVSFEWNDHVTKFNRPEGKQLGFIAQELQTVFPEKIKEDKQGYLMTAYSTYDPVFVEAIRELNNKIEDQQQTIETLLKRLADIEKQLDKSVSTVK